MADDERLDHARRLDDRVGAAAFRRLSHSRHGIVAARYRDVRAERFGQRALVGAARDADDRCAACFRELHVQLAGDAEAEDDHELAREDVDLPLRVKAGREHLNQRRDASLHRAGSGKTWLGGTVRYSAKPPSRSRPTSMPFVQRCVWPIRQ